MSFIITVYTNEGIIMASDSRTTYTTTDTLPDGTVEKKIGVQLTDTTYKTFMCNKYVGISTCGTASINNMPITGFIEDFITQKVSENSTVDEVAQGALDYFSAFNPIPNTNFIVAGYNPTDFKQCVARVYVGSNLKTQVDTSVSGVAWDGETEVFKRLIKSVALKNADGSYSDLQHYPIGYNYFTLQDAINFAQFAVDVTIKTMFFQDCVKTVGGPIDILAIKPSGSFWIQRKELHP